MRFRRRKQKTAEVWRFMEERLWTQISLHNPYILCGMIQEHIKTDRYSSKCLKGGFKSLSLVHHITRDWVCQANGCTLHDASSSY
jgi:hypothetical protein